MTIKGSKIEIKELSSIRVLSDDGINPSEMDNVVGGHGYHGHYGHHGYYGYIYNYVQDYIKDYIKGFFGKEKENKKEDTEVVRVARARIPSSAVPGRR